MGSGIQYKYCLVYFMDQYNMLKHTNYTFKVVCHMPIIQLDHGNKLCLGIIMILTVMLVFTGKG